MISPKLVKKLDPGVRRLVVLLDSLGFVTVDSGDGVSKPPVGRTLDVPHVFCDVEPLSLAQEADRMARALAEVGIKVEAQGPGEGRKSIVASYDPANSRAVIALIGVTDHDLPADGSDQECGFGGIQA